jgi:DNA gyrase/topoisomerase IV subunit A
MVEEEAQEIADKHGDDRRTALVYDGASPRPLACPSFACSASSPVLSDLAAPGQAPSFDRAGGVELRDEDIIPNDPGLVVFSRKGYIKRMSPDTFAVQGRAGTGASSSPPPLLAALAQILR